MATEQEKAQKREITIFRLMNQIGETFTAGADHFIKLWPKEDPALIREAVERLKNPAPREGRPR